METVLRGVFEVIDIDDFRMKPSQKNLRMVQLVEGGGTKVKGVNTSGPATQARKKQRG